MDVSYLSVRITHPQTGPNDGTCFCDRDRPFQGHVKPSMDDHVERADCLTSLGDPDKTTRPHDPRRPTTHPCRPRGTGGEPRGPERTVRRGWDHRCRKGSISRFRDFFLFVGILFSRDFDWDGVGVLRSTDSGGHLNLPEYRDFRPVFPRSVSGLRSLVCQRRNRPRVVATREE